MKSDQIDTKTPGAVIRPQFSKVLSKKDKEWVEEKKYLHYGLILAVVIASLLFINTYIAQLFIVNGISMQPTFHTGDVVLVWKAPQTWAKLTGAEYVPKRGSVVIIQGNNVAHEQLIKRVIALPDERVDIANNNITVYSNQYPKGIDPDAAPFAKDLLPPVGTFSTQVEVGQIFVMGDNRNPGASIDSRSSLGNVPTNIVIGQVVVKLLPLSDIKVF
ncbi:MAG TPA: signal peptidase I [Candidatus Saccharimonadales bacterium]|jgi:signal peptidase I|nr:signal peptidase I [Candidatus Saccharimonadales bacterium]